MRSTKSEISLCGIALVLFLIFLVTPSLSALGRALPVLTVGSSSESSQTSIYAVKGEYGASGYVLSKNATSVGASVSEVVALTAEFNDPSILFQNDSASITTTAYQSLYAISQGVGNLSGNVLAGIAGNVLSVTSPRQLMRVFLVQNQTYQVAWQGYLQTEGIVRGEVYYNPEQNANLFLIYAGTNSLWYYNLTLSAGYPSLNFALEDIPQVDSQLLSNSSTQLAVPISMPEKYSSPAEIGFSAPLLTFNFGNNTLQFELNRNLENLRSFPTVEYFNESLVPGLKWKGSGLSFENGPGLINMGYNETSVAMYGINGTSTLGFFYAFYGATDYQLPSSTGIIGSEHYTYGMTIVVTSSNPAYIPGMRLSTSNILVGNYSAVIIIGGGRVETTASLASTRAVSLAKNGTCAWTTLEIGSSQQQIIICNESVSYVTSLTPESVTTGSVTINGKNLSDQEVILNASGYISFSVPLAGDSNNFSVYKETQGGPAPLDPSNYYVSNGEVVVLADPAFTYYIVYPEGLTGQYALTVVDYVAFAAIFLAVVLAVAIVAKGRKIPSYPDSFTAEKNTRTKRNWFFPKQSRSTFRSGVASVASGTLALAGLLLFPIADEPELVFQLILLGSLFTIVHGALSIPYSRMQATREQVERRETEERRKLGLS